MELGVRVQPGFPLLLCGFPIPLAQVSDLRRHEVLSPFRLVVASHLLMEDTVKFPPASRGTATCG